VAARGRAAGQDPHHGTVESGIGDHHVRPSPEHEQTITAAVGGGDCLDHLLVGARFDESAGRAAETERGQRRERDVELLYRGGRAEGGGQRDRVRVLARVSRVLGTHSWLSGSSRPSPARRAST
jgi:hypothetical protein